MSRYLKKKGQMLFLGPKGTWVRELTQAMSFTTTDAASKTAVELKLYEVEIYFSFANTVSNYDFSLPLAGITPPMASEPACTRPPP